MLTSQEVLHAHNSYTMRKMLQGQQTLLKLYQAVCQNTVFRLKIILCI